MFDGKYLEWNQKKIKTIVDFYGHKFIYLKKVLDLGCGYGDVSGVLHRLGGDITALDARQEHLKVASKKYPGMKTVKVDLDRGWPFIGKHFDIILDLDLMSHLRDYESHLKNVCASCNHLVLETSVVDSDDLYCKLTSNENKNIYDLSMNGIGSHSSTASIERILSESGMNFKRIDNAKLNASTYTYDWIPKNNNVYDVNKRRMWFAVKNNSPVQFAHQDPPKIISNALPPTLGIAPVLINTGITVADKHNIINPNILDYPENKFKIAICISGHLRTFEQTYKSFITNVVNPLSCDIFIHTWDTIGFSSGGKGYFDKSIGNIKTSSKEKSIQNLYNPKELIIDSYNEKQKIIQQKNSQVNLSKQDKDGLLDGSLLSYGSMLYSRAQVKQLAFNYANKNNINYDLVISLRPDLMFVGKLDIRNAIGKLLVPTVGKYYPTGMNDQFAIGDPHYIKTYLSLFDNIVEYFQKRVISVLRPEPLLKYHLQKNKILLTEEHINYYILRANGEIYYPPS